MADGVTGFNADQANELGSKIETIAQNCATAVVETVQNEIIGKAVNAWYAEEAQTFFSNVFAPAVKETGGKMTEAFNSFIISIAKAILTWVETTGGGASTIKAIALLDTTIDTSPIQAEQGGNRGINENELKALQASATSAYTTLKDTFKTYAAELEATTAFLGYGQAEAVQNCFTKVTEATAGIFEKILGSGEGSLSDALEKYRAKYQATAESIAQGYNNSME